MKKNAPVSATAGTLDPKPSPANGQSARKQSNRLASIPRVPGEVANGHGDPNQNEILRALTALKKGHFSERLPLHWQGVSGKIADVFNELAELMEHSTQDLSRISRVVGREGKLTERLPRGET